MEKIRRNKTLAGILILAFGVLTSAGIVIADDVTTQVTVGNSAPSVDQVEINSSTAIDLTENTTTAVTVVATTSDSNGCSQISTVVADLYRSGVTAAGCDTAGESDDDSCYPRVSCTVQGGTCTGGADTDAVYDCSFALQFHADPTDAGAFSAQDWEATIYANDGVATSTGTDTETVNTLNALNVTASIGYGTLSAGATSTTQTSTTTNTGNAAIDAQISGTAMDDGGSNEIATSSQSYGTSSVPYESLTFALSGTPTQRELDLAKPTDGASLIEDNVYWGIQIPGGQPTGTYNGTNTFTPVSD